MQKARGKSSHEEMGNKQEEENMGHRISVVILFIALLIPVISAAADLENFIQVKGEASTVVKPDIAHCFLIVSGYGASYEAASKAANDKFSQLGEVLKSVLQKAPQLDVLKVENKPRGKTFDEAYQKELFMDMAKAMKGEAPSEAGPAKKEMATNISVYFTLSNFSKDSILRLMNSLAEKEIAFDKSSMFDFDFAADFAFNKSAIYYGMASSEKYLEALASQAFKKAERDAKIIASAVNKKLSGLVNVTGCGDILEGSVSLPFKTNLTGKDLGPLSADSSRLMIKFSKDFGFRIE